MSVKTQKTKSLTKCSACPLRDRKRFRDFDKAEASFVSSFKTGEMHVEAGSTVLVEGANSAHLFTILDGWAYRYKSLEDGRKQIMNYALPGDMIGLQGTISGEMEHSIETLSDVTLCVFERDRLMELFRKFPELGFDLTWIAAREEVILEENLLSVGRRTALERSAYLLAFLFYRSQVHLEEVQKEVVLPIPQQHIADTLGLSIVHTNKTLKKLVDRGLIKWLDRGGCLVKDAGGLCNIAAWEPDFGESRPFI